MSESTSSLAIWSYGIAGFSYAFLFFYLLKQAFGRHPGVPGRAMLVAMGLTSVWAFVAILATLFDSGFLLVLHFMVDELRYAAWFGSLLLLAAPAGKPLLERLFHARTLAPFTFGVVLAGLLCQLFILLGHGSPALLNAVQLSRLAITVCGLVLLEQLLRNSTPDTRWHFKPMGLGLAGSFVFDLYLFSNMAMFSQLDEDMFAVRGLIVALIAPLIALSIARNKNKALRLALSQSAVFHSTTLLAVGVYLLFVSAAGYYVRYFGGNWGRALQLALFFAALLVLLLIIFSGSMRAKMRVIVGKHFFRYRYDYREEWLKFTNTLSAETGHREVCLRVIRGLADMVESPAGALWLRDSNAGVYQQAARWNVAELGTGIPARGDAIVDFLTSSGWVFNLEEYRHMPTRYQGVAVLPAWLQEIPNAWLLIPLSVGRELVGFVLLSTARTHLDVDWEVNDLLKTAGSQAATHIAQMQATEALLEARKFDSFNRMSAFVVHDLKNIITQLSLMVKNADRHWDNPEFQQDMLMTVQNSVERMRQLMLQLRAGAAPVAGTFGVKLGEILHAISRAKATQRPEIAINIEQNVTARGHEERIERVLGHVLQNALDATPPTGQVLARLCVQDGMALVEVRDTGEGMSAEFVRERLFKPFQTTKEAGMGIGAYESFQYVQELGGRIEVESEVGAGTCVRMYFPLFEVKAESELQRLEMA